MKIAAVTEDGITISAHFGRAPYFEIVVVEDGAIVQRERRDKLGHAQFSSEPHAHVPGEQHGVDAASRGRHARMLDAISDCQVLLARGMGFGAYESARQAGIRPVITEERTIEDAVRHVIDGSIRDHTERLH